MKLQLFSLLLCLSCTYAAPLVGSLSNLIGGQMDITVEIDEAVKITMRGPDDTWFGVGFGSKIMEGAYAIIATSDFAGNLTVEEWSLGPHQRGSLLDTQSLQVVSDVIDGIDRTVIVERAIIGTTYSFPVASTDIDIIASDGSSGVIEYAVARSMGEFTNTTLSVASESVPSFSGQPTLEPTIEPTVEPSLEPTLEPRTGKTKPSKPAVTDTSSTTAAPAASPVVSSTLPPNVFLYASSQLNDQQTISFYNEQLVKAQLVIEISGPSDAYFAVGFGDDQMDGTYAFVVDKNGGVSERILGSNAAGSILQSTTTVLINQVNDDIRTVAILRFANVDSAGYYNFDAFINCEADIPLIYSYTAGEELDLYASDWENDITISGDCTTTSPSEEEIDPTSAAYDVSIATSVLFTAMSIFYVVFA